MAKHLNNDINNSETSKRILRILVTIPARGGSKGIPRKALRMIGDLPIIAYTIRDAAAIKGATKVFVNTDDPEIQTVSIAYGAEVPFLRPRELAQDDSKLEEASKYARNWYRDNENFIPDIEIVMSPTHPFRRQNLVNDALRRGLANPEIINLGSIAPAKVMTDNYWAKGHETMRRFHFNAGQVHAKTVLYQSAFSFNIVFNCRPNLFNRRIPIVLNEIESIDIDEPKDLELARTVIAEGLYPFNEWQ
jgi:CMP-N-acetylneuraminic acid synthetase